MYGCADVLVCWCVDMVLNCWYCAELLIWC
jgi:hypothetical protein